MSGCSHIFSRLLKLVVLLAVLHSIQGNINNEYKEDNIRSNEENILAKFKRVPAGKRSAGDIGEMAKLEILLIHSWKEMDKMLLCTKSSKCVKNYLKNIQTGNTVVKANLIQSLGFTLDIIKQLSNRVKEIKM